MQLEAARARFRGYRSSRFLVSLGKALTSDLTRLLNRQLTNEAAYGALEADVETLSTTRLSEIRHCQVQAHYRLQNRE